MCLSGLASSEKVGCCALCRAAVGAAPRRRGRRRAGEASLPLHAQRIRVLIAAIPRGLALPHPERATPKRVPHGRPRARARHAGLEGLRKVVGRRDRRAHLRHRVIGRRGSVSRRPGQGEVDGRRERRRREASRVAG